MKKSLLVFSLTVALSFSTKAQTSVYHPFPDSDAVWKDYYGECLGIIDGGENTETRHFLNGDTLINGILYHKLSADYSQVAVGYCWNYGAPTGPYYYWINLREGAIRQDSSKHIFFYSYDSLTEELLYDFNLQVGTIVPFSYIHKDSTQKIFVSAIDSIFDGMNYRSRYILSDSVSGTLHNNTTSLIEGIGSTWGLLAQIDLGAFEPPLLDLRCFTQDDIVRYYDSSFFCLSCSASCGVLSVDNLQNQFEISVSPNPFHTSVILSISDSRFTNGDLKIYDVMGRLVQSQIINPENSGSTIINRAGLGDGLYFYQLSNSDGLMLTGKFVVD